MILFLDIDGVLHGLGRPIFENLQRLEAVLREFPQVDVVISSSWRETYPWDVITEFFDEDIRHQIVGMTPVIPTKWPPYSRCVRFEEIQEFLALQIPVQPWFVLDDDPLLFPSDCPELILCDPAAGFDEKTADLLRSRLNEARWRSV